MLYGEQFLKQTEPQVFYPQAILALIGVALAFVVGLGWLTDPNYLSLHAFYTRAPGARLPRRLQREARRERGRDHRGGRRATTCDLWSRGTDVGPKTRPASVPSHQYDA